jgi:hypothetical protein
MNEDAFWALVDRSKLRAADDLTAQAEVLAQSLAELPVAEIVEFDRLFVDASLALYSWELWGAATLLHGWCSGDVFADFRAWVVSLGRETYERVRATPDALIEVGLDDLEVIGEAEAFAFAACQVFEAKTGGRLWDAVPGRRSADSADGGPSGERFERTDDELSRRFPRLAARWMAPNGDVMPGQLPRALF